MPGRSAAGELEQARLLEAIRIRGVRGGVITPHRSMVGLPWTLWRLFTTLLLALGGLALFLAALPALGQFWQLLFQWARDLLGLDAPLGDRLLTIRPGITFTLPVLAVPTPQPTARALWIAGAASALVLAVTFALPERFTPLRYFLRLVVLLQSTSIAFFALSPGPLPYLLQDHVFVLQAAGLVVMGLVPLVLGLTLHVFDLALWKKALLTALILGHLAVYLPLKLLLHVELVLRGTALLMPTLFLLFGLLLDVLVFVAFYGWALSWRGELERKQVLPPVHLGVRELVP